MPFLRKYNAIATIDGVPLITRGAMDFKSNPTLAVGDVKISKDGGAFANLATLPTVTPTGDTSVEVALSATELQCARAVIRFTDQTNPKEWEDQEIIVETFGNASAQIAGDLNNLDATITSRQASGAAVTVGTNNDKSGYTLTQTFPSNFSALSITSGGAVTINTGFRKNVAYNNFEFTMISSTDHITPKTGLTVTSQVSIDGAAFVNTTNTASEVALGVYKISFSAADLNGNTCTFNFTGTGADATTVTIITTP